MSLISNGSTPQARKNAPAPPNFDAGSKGLAKTVIVQMKRRLCFGLTSLCIVSLCLAVSGLAMAESGLNLHTDLGYRNLEPNPYVLIGADLGGTRNHLNYGVGLANVIDIHDGLRATALTLGGGWQPFASPFGSLRLSANAYIHGGDAPFAQNLYLQGAGHLGTMVTARFNYGYMERPLHDLLPQANNRWNDFAIERPLSYFDASVITRTAMNQRWMYELEAVQYLQGPGIMAIATGGELQTDSGSFALSGGVLFGEEATVPLARMRYQHYTDHGGVFQLAYETTSLLENGPAIEAGYQLHSGWWTLETSLRWDADHRNTPALNFGISSSLF